MPCCLRLSMKPRRRRSAVVSSTAFKIRLRFGVFVVNADLLQRAIDDGHIELARSQTRVRTAAQSDSSLSAVLRIHRAKARVLKTCFAIKVCHRVAQPSTLIRRPWRRQSGQPPETRSGISSAFMEIQTCQSGASLQFCKVVGRRTLAPELHQGAGGHQTHRPQSRLTCPSPSPTPPPPSLVPRGTLGRGCRRAGCRAPGR